MLTSAAERYGVVSRMSAREGSDCNDLEMQSSWRCRLVCFELSTRHCIQSAPRTCTLHLIHWQPPWRKIGVSDCPCSPSSPSSQTYCVHVSMQAVPNTMLEFTLQLLIYETLRWLFQKKTRFHIQNALAWTLPRFHLFTYLFFAYNVLIFYVILAL